MFKRLLIAPGWGIAFVALSYGMMITIMFLGTLVVSMLPGLENLAEPFGTFCGVSLMTVPFVALFAGMALSLLGKLPYTK